MSGTGASGSGAVAAGERGSASLWVLATASLVLVAAVVVSMYGVVAAARHRASSAADLAALAAADRMLSGGANGSCRAAADVARRNGARLRRCLTSGGVADVTADVPLRGAFARLGATSARARAVPGAVTGPVALPGTVTGDAGPGAMGPDGLTPRTRRVRDLVRKRFGEHEIGGYCPGGCHSGHIPGSDHYTGHAIDVMILPWHDPSRVAQGWRIASFLVANARPLALKYVIYRARIWTPDRGWHAYSYPLGPTSNPTLMHMDHIHVSVS